MPVDSVSTFGLQQSTLRDVSKAMTSLSNAQKQLSSGYKSQDFAGIASNAQQFLSLDSRMMKIQQYLNDNGIIAARIDATSNTLGSIITDTATKIRDLIGQRRNGAQAQSLSFDEQMNGYWQSLSSQLNTSSEGRYLFGGTKTDTPPVNTESFPTNYVSGVPDDSYYLGSQQDLTVRPQDDVQITYNVRADNPAFQKIFAGMALATEAAASNSSGGEVDTKLAQAYDLVQSGITSLISVKATVDTNKVLINDTITRLTAQQTYWKIIKEDIIKTDVLSVSTELTVNQGILTASFQAFAKINSLRLSDFLR